MTVVGMKPLDNVPIKSKILLVKGNLRRFRIIKRSIIGESLVHHNSFISYSSIIHKEKK